jgi:thiamine-phosphate pyrophosphorylase
MTAPRVVLVTDPSFGDDEILRCVEAAGRALERGALCVQLRDKRRARPSLRVAAMALRQVTRAVGARLVVNGDAGLARDVGADGVHLGTGAETVSEARAAFGRRAWISVAAHSDDDVRRAIAEGADAALVSPIFSKAARGLEAIRAARAVSERRILLYALGGVTPETARACVSAGADGVAVIRALLASGRGAARVARALDVVGDVVGCRDHGELRRVAPGHVRAAPAPPGRGA